MNNLKQYKLGSLINACLWPVFTVVACLFGCMGCLYSSTPYGSMFFVFAILGAYTFLSWLFSKKAINALETEKNYKNIHRMNIIFGLFYSFYPALKAYKESEDAHYEKKERAKFIVPNYEGIIIAALIGIGIFVLDLITKQLVVKFFTASGAPANIVLIGSAAKPFLRISYVINVAAAFGFGVGNELTNRIVYCVVASLGFIAIVSIFVWKRKTMPFVMKICLLAIAAGALGNLVDRIFYSAEFLGSASNGVVDWIDFAGIWSFVFNIADCGVVLGAIALIIWLIVDEVKENKRKKALEPKKERPQGPILSKEEQERLQNEEKVENK
ncbi:MAG: signal peptidase II [Bacilli bacterium]|nr:signal peptidase II [Bacilli bacterium]